MADPYYTTTTISLPHEPGEEEIYIRAGEQLTEAELAVLEQATWADGQEGPTHLQNLIDNGAVTTEAPVLELPAEPVDGEVAAGDGAQAKDIRS